jgi:hypothetical protein
MTGERLSATRLIEASPSAVFAVLSDPDGHVAIDSSGMLQDATGSPLSAVGDSFVVHMDRESLGDYPELGRYDVTVRVTGLLPERLIEWTVESERFNLGHRYGYELQRDDTGTVTTAYYDWSTVSEKWKPIFPVVPASALAATLGILDRTVRRGYPRPRPA